MVSSPDDPQLHSTGIVEDAHIHDEVIALKLSYMHHGCFFTVLLSSQPAQNLDCDSGRCPTNSAIQNLIARYNEACTWIDNDKSVEDVDKRLDPIWQQAEDLVMATTFDKIRALGRQHEQHTVDIGVRTTTAKTLACHIFPTSFNLELSADKAGLKTICRPDLPQSSPFTVEPAVTLQPGLISVDATDVLIIERYRPHVLKVQTGQEILCCKLNNAGAQDSFEREFQTLCQVNRSESRDHIRIPKLKGTVQVEDGIIGLLMDDVDSEVLNLTVLLEQNKDLSDSEKQRWSEQISEALGYLHDLNLIWGDAKTDNVLIDKRRNAWLVDFGGGYTAGWVDEALYNTQAGDLQGLGKILSAINKKR